MAVRAEDKKQETLQGVYDRIGQRVGPPQADLLKTFAGLLFDNVSADDVVVRDPEHIYGLTLSVWQHARKRAADQGNVRAYTPVAAQHGWRAGHTIVEVVIDDKPFIVDSLRGELERRGSTVHLVIHPVLWIKRDADGLIETVLPATASEAERGDAITESVVLFEINEITAQDELDELGRAVRSVLDDVGLAVADWPAMREKAQQAIQPMKQLPASLSPEEVSEADAFLQWMRDDNFTFIGYREHGYVVTDADVRIDVWPETGLGILRDSDRLVFKGARNMASNASDVHSFLTAPQVIEVNKGGSRSTIHRTVYMDVIGVKVFDDQGQVTGERVFVGLFTSSAYSQSPRRIPFLRRKVSDVIKRGGLAPRGHAAKALTHILDSYPRDELFQIGLDDLQRIAFGVLRLQDRNRVALFPRWDVYHRFVSVLVYVPKDRLDNRLTTHFGALLAKAYNGKVSDFFLALDEGRLARIHYIIGTEPDRALKEADDLELESQLIDAARTWSDKLREELVNTNGEERGLALHNRYGDGFPALYQSRFHVDVAVSDINDVEALLAARDDIRVNLHRPIEAPETQVYLKVYHKGGPITLAMVMPILDNAGVMVDSEVPFEITARGPEGSSETVFMHDFRMGRKDGEAIEFVKIRDAFQEMLTVVWSGLIEDDGFNRLVLGAALSWRQVVVLRAYAKYLQQIRLGYSQDLMIQTLARHPDCTAMLVDIFETQFDPDLPDDMRENRLEQCQQAFEAALELVSSLDEDTILRRFRNVISATLRTNHYQRDDHGGVKGYLSLKFDSQEINGLPAPKPWREIFVYSPRFEAVHLRGGPVARGGLRWSDRREDFRTEILGLVKAQMVKNAVIVPVGSKGGFVLKKPPPASAGRDAFLSEGIACYRIFMAGLLDITDNLIEGRVFPRDRVTRRDGDDPYLVVAADKGTATFSDFANEVSVQYGHWLGDAFASGGSVGYDHKKMGITARGAWESVKRHFRELGKNTQAEPFTVVGIGDMSGDVFGNGMLLSPHIKLIAAFNHLHIFVDPDPDPASSFAERQRLFALPRGGWQAYDTAKLSAGGMIFERSAKSLTLTPQIKALFGISQDRVSPIELMRAILLSQVELLWFGGIGTYIKSSLESHSDVGDKANDILRINADELRCGVIGEGANLGVTQAARIEASMRGVKLNTDAIDNSAGVDCSDHEVNIKILLADAEQRGDMTRKQRDQLLERMTDEVATLVLRDNYLQTQAISLAERQASSSFDQQVRFMTALEKTGQLDRAIEGLPDNDEIAARRERGDGLTRPELAVLLAYAKITLYEDILRSDLPDDPKLVEDLVTYFPTELRERYRDRIESHQLRREIIATSVTNSIVNRAGPTFIRRVMESSGMREDHIARAYIVARNAFGVRDLWRGIEALDTELSADAQMEMLLTVKATMEQLVGWFLNNARHPLDIADVIARFQPGVEALKDCLETALSAKGRQALARRRDKLVARGVPDSLSMACAQLPLIAAAPDLIRVSADQSAPISSVAMIYFGLGDRLGLNQLRAAAEGMKSETHWQRLATSAVVDDLFTQQSQLTTKVLPLLTGTDRAAADAAIEQWRDGRGAAMVRYESLLVEVQANPKPDLAMLAVALRQLRNLTAT